MSRRPCKCDRPACGVCWLYRTSDYHNRKWGGPGVSTAGRRPPAAARLAPGARVPLPLRLTQCAHLGEKARPNCGCTDRHCTAGRGIVRLTVECQTCDGYAPRR